MESFSASTNSFALDLYKKLNETSKGQNIFFAPWSIATALAMVYLGAKGDTAAQMAKVSCEISSIKAGSHMNCITHLPMWNRKEQHGENSDLSSCWVQEIISFTLPAVLQVTVLPVYFQELPTLLLPLHLAYT